MKLEDIQPIAIEIWQDIKQYCEKGKCKIGGSIRRQEKNCNDIELVALPIDRSNRNKLGLILYQKVLRYEKVSLQGVMFKWFLIMSR